MCFKFLPICMFIIHMHTFFIFSGYGLMLKFCTVNSFLIHCLAVHFHNDIFQYTDIPNFNKAQLVLFSPYRLIFCVCVCSIEKSLPTSRHGHVFSFRSLFQLTPVFVIICNRCQGSSCFITIKRKDHPFSPRIAVAFLSHIMDLTYVGLFLHYLHSIYRTKCLLI